MAVLQLATCGASVKALDDEVLETLGPMEVGVQMASRPNAQVVGSTACGQTEQPRKNAAQNAAHFVATIARHLAVPQLDDEL